MAMRMAAEAVSFESLERGWISSPWRSMAASMAELTSSNARMEKTVAIKIARWVAWGVTKKIARKKKGATKTSVRNDGSPQAPLSPAMEYPNALSLPWMPLLDSGLAMILLAIKKDDALNAKIIA